MAEDAELARMCADGAANVLTELRRTGTATGADGDAAAQRVIMEILRDQRPDDAVLSEESHDDGARLHAERVWIVDPLDGTREFAEAGRIDWAVHVALWSAGELVAGAVALPATGRTLTTAAPPTVPSVGNRPPRITVSRSRPAPFLPAVAEAVGGQLVPMGSAGYKVSAVISGEVDAYIHAGGQYEWDSAAPVVVARAAGLHASRIDGAPLVYNQPDPYLPDILVCRPELADVLLAELRSSLKAAL